MPGSSRSGTPRSSAPAPTRSACWPITASGPSRSPACSLAAVVAAIIGLASGLVLLRTTGLTLLDAHALHHGAARGGREHGPRLHRRLRRPRQPADLADLRAVRVQSALLEHAVSLCARGPVRLLRVRAHAGLFAVRPEPDRNPREHAAHARGRLAGARAAGHLLHHLGRHRRHRRRAVGAGLGLCQPERAQPRSRRRRAHHPDSGRLWPPLRRLRRRRRLYAAVAFSGADFIPPPGSSGSASCWS